MQKILNEIPILKSTWVQIRWSAFYILPLIFLTVFVLDSLKYLKKILIYIFLFVVVLQNIFYDKSYYQNQFYNPTNMFELSKNITYAHEKINYDIKGFGFLTDKYGKISNDMIRNDFFSMNLSSLFCYQPIFGYSLENFPLEKLIINKRVKFDTNHYLSTGDLELIQKNNINVINFLNPSCFLFPKENNCKPGDLFNASDNDNLKNFINYKPIKFNKSLVQIFLDYLSLLSFILLIILIIINLYLYYYKRFTR